MKNIDYSCYGERELIERIEELSSFVQAVYGHFDSQPMLTEEEESLLERSSELLKQ